MPKWLDIAKDLLENHTPESREETRILHSLCNDLLYRFRCGGRRWSHIYIPLRRDIREIRDTISFRWKLDY